MGGMDRQTLRDWTHRFNARSPDGLKDAWAKGQPPRLTVEQQLDFARLVKSGPDGVTHGGRAVAAGRPAAEIQTRFGVTYHERTVGKILKGLGFSTSARARATRPRTRRC